MKNRILGALLALFALSWPAMAQNPSAPPPTSFYPPAAITPVSLAVTGTTASVALPADPTAYPAVGIVNNGTAEVFCRPGGSSVTAATNNYMVAVPSGGYRAFWDAQSTYVACITATGTATVRITQSNGAPQIGLVLSPSSLPPSGAAGGDLAGTYPNPTVAQASAGFTVIGNTLHTATPTASQSAILLNGTVLTGGSGTTNFPTIFIQPTGATAATTYSTAGTGLGLNMASGFTGNFVDFRVNGATSAFIVSAAGTVQSAAGGQFSFAARARILSPADNQVQLTNSASSGFTRLQFGGGTSSFMALGISGTTIALVAADGTIPTYASCTGLTTNSSGIIGCTASDPRLKIIDRAPYAGGLHGITRLSRDGGTIIFRGKPGNPENVDTRRQVGFNCWKVRAALPMATHDDKKGYCNLDPEAIQAALVNAVAEQSDEIAMLKARIDVRH